MNGYEQDGCVWNMTDEHAAWLDGRDTCFVCDRICEPDANGIYTCPANSEHNETLTWTR